MIEVFKTNILEETIAEAIRKELSSRFPEFLINFDLEDCDKILRIENCAVETKSVIHLINEKGFYCEVLE